MFHYTPVWVTNTNIYSGHLFPRLIFPKRLQTSRRQGRHFCCLYMQSAFSGSCREGTGHLQAFMIWLYEVYLYMRDIHPVKTQLETSASATGVTALESWLRHGSQLPTDTYPWKQGLGQVNWLLATHGGDLEPIPEFSTPGLSQVQLKLLQDFEK